MLNFRFSKAFYVCNSFLLIVTPLTLKNKTASTIAFHMEINPVEKALEIPSASETENEIPYEEAPQINLNKKEALFIRKYIRHRGDCLVNVKKRSIIPFYIIDSVFTIYNIPVELKYLAVIESELKPTALSHVGARGPWQLMPGTGRILGLKINHTTDERINFTASTRAAARYLRDLYAQFDDWLLVIAAYNGGPKPVYKAIRKSRSKDFWVLQKYLPAESRQHVKKFIATHYYFEGHGSETTLTRTENLAYMKAVNDYELKKSNLATVEKDHQKPEAEKPMETSEQKFKRIMKESETCLHKSEKLT
jgi:membrane-bound lytic murein transglycosylase D